MSIGMPLAANANFPMTALKSRVAALLWPALDAAGACCTAEWSDLGCWADFECCNAADATESVVDATSCAGAATESPAADIRLIRRFDCV